MINVTLVQETGGKAYLTLEDPWEDCFGKFPHVIEARRRYSSYSDQRDEQGRKLYFETTEPLDFELRPALRVYYVRGAR